MKKAKILVVDDSSLARRTIRQYVEEMGYTVEEAVDGAQALERYFLNRHDLIVLDMVMKGMYGVEVLGKLRQIDPTVPIIVATADIQKSTLEQVNAAGASGFINKPVNREEFTRLVTKVLSERKE